MAVRSCVTLASVGFCILSTMTRSVNSGIYSPLHDMEATSTVKLPLTMVTLLTTTRI